MKTQTQQRPSPSTRHPSPSPVSSPSPSSPSSPAAAPPKRRYKEVWLIEDHPKRKAMWTRVGVAFENNDGSWALQLAAVPTGANRLQVRDPRPIEANTEAGAIHDAANDDDDVRVAA